MYSPTDNLRQRFAGVRAMVLGDAMLDAYTTGTVSRFCPEGPVPVYDMANTRYCAGGAANTASNLAALGAQVRLLSVVGNDTEGERLFDLQARASIDTSLSIQCAGRRTLSKHRVHANSQLLMRLDQGTTSAITNHEESLLIERLRHAFASLDLIIVSDYGYGAITPRIIECLDERPVHCLLCIDSKDLTRFAQIRPDIVKPNYAQACRLLGVDSGAIDCTRCESMGRYQHQLQSITGARIVALTCDQDGCVCMMADHDPIRVPARTCHRPRVAGAGDTFIATMGLAVAAGEPLANAARLASQAAGCVVDKEGTATCSIDELLRCESGMGRSWDVQALARHLTEQREHGHRIVLTCGCFDILHHGHVEYLRRARSLGDRLIVAVNTDESIRRLKGPERPINPLSDRLEVLAALDCIDYLLAFSEDTPHGVIQAIQPDVFVKGGDYSRSTLPEAALVERLGGRVEFIPMVENRSTTRIIDRILTGAGGTAFTTDGHDAASVVAQG